MSGNVLTNNTDVEHNTLTAALMATTAHGALSLAPNGAFTYTPAANYNGPDSFTFRGNDGNVGATRDDEITVNPVNDAPVAAGQSVSTNEDTAKAIALVETDIDGDTLTYGMVSSPAHGTLTGSARGADLHPGRELQRHRQLHVPGQRRQANSNTATVTITIIAVNDAPVAVDDARPPTRHDGERQRAEQQQRRRRQCVDGGAGGRLGPRHVHVERERRLHLSSGGRVLRGQQLRLPGQGRDDQRNGDGDVEGSDGRQVAANVSVLVAAIDRGLRNDVAKIMSGNAKSSGDA